MYDTPTKSFGGRGITSAGFNVLKHPTHVDVFGSQFCSNRTSQVYALGLEYLKFNCYGWIKVNIASSSQTFSFSAEGLAQTVALFSNDRNLKRYLKFVKKTNRVGGGGYIPFLNSTAC